MPNDSFPGDADVPTVTYVAPAAAQASFDPLRYCVMTTVALLAWLLGPAIVILVGGLGLWAYGTAIRGGLTRTRCVLRHPMLVLAYLAAVCVLAVVAVVRTVLR